MEWVAKPNPQPPYQSFGNGSAMRVSPCAWLAGSLDEDPSSFTPSRSIHRVVIPNIHQHDAVVLDEKLNRDPVRKIDRYGMKPFELPVKGMQSKGGMMGLGLEELKGFEID